MNFVSAAQVDMDFVPVYAADTDSVAVPPADQTEAIDENKPPRYLKLFGFMSTNGGTSAS